MKGVWLLLAVLLGAVSAVELHAGSHARMGSAERLMEREALVEAAESGRHGAPGDNVFYRAIRKQKMYIQGTLGSRYLQSDSLTTVAFSYVKGDVLSKGNMTAHTLAGTTVHSEDTSVHILASASPTHRVLVKGRVQVDGKLIYTGENVKATVDRLLKAHKEMQRAELERRDRKRRRRLAIKRARAKAKAIKDKLQKGKKTKGKGKKGKAKAKAKAKGKKAKGKKTKGKGKGKAKGKAGKKKSGKKSAKAKPKKKATKKKKKKKGTKKGKAKAKKGAAKGKAKKKPKKGKAKAKKTKKKKKNTAGTAFFETLSVVSHASDDASADFAAGKNFHKQWQLVSHHDFAEGAKGWTFSDGTSAEKHVHHCGNGDMFLSMACQSADRMQHVSKVYDNLPPHTRLELTARVHFIDQWRGDVAFAMIDHKTVWMDSHGAKAATAPPAHTLNLCGGDWAGDRLSVPVKVIIPHTAKSVHLTFGSNLEHLGNNKCIASLGIDDISLAVH